MGLRNKNYVSEIVPIATIEKTIKALTAGKKYYFNVNVNKLNYVYYVEVENFSDGKAFKLFKDKTTYIDTNSYADIKDELIKVIKSTSQKVVLEVQQMAMSEQETKEITIYVDEVLVDQSETPDASMAHYVLTYIDAMQTINNNYM